MKTRAHVFVSGRVQGVFYRAFTRDAARLNGVNGWVRNLSDGRVEAVFEGEKEAVDRVIEELKLGPSHSDVKEVAVNFDDYKGEFTGFNIRYS